MSMLLEDLEMPYSPSDSKPAEDTGCGCLLLLIGGTAFMLGYAINKAYEAKHPETVKPVQKTQTIKPVQNALDTLKASDTLKIMNKLKMDAKINVK